MMIARRDRIKNTATKADIQMAIIPDNAIDILNPLYEISE